jgi:hypothetical protein
VTHVAIANTLAAMRILSALLVVVLAVAACSSDEPAPETTTTTTVLDTSTFVTYRSEELSFEVDHPGDWQVLEDPASGVVTFSAPEPVDGFIDNFTVAVSELPSSVTPRDYYDAQVEEIPNLFPGSELLEDVDLVIDGYLARGYTLITDEIGVDIGLTRLILQIGTDLWEVSYFVPAARLESSARMIQEVLASFRPLV